MSINLNADVGKILKDLLDKKSSKSTANSNAQNKFGLYRNTILYSILILCGFVSVSFAMYHKANNSIKPDESEFKTSQEIDDALLKLDADLKSQRINLKNNIFKAKELLPKFTALGEEKKLFKLISQLADDSNIYIRQISKDNVVKAPKTEAEPQQVKKFIESPITLVMTGTFKDYLAFKQELLIQKPVLKIDIEQININKIGDDKSSINILLKITDFVTDKQDFENVISKYENNT